MYPRGLEKQQEVERVTGDHPDAASCRAGAIVSWCSLVPSHILCHMCTHTCRERQDVAPYRNGNDFCTPQRNPGTVVFLQRAIEVRNAGAWLLFPRVAQSWKVGHCLCLEWIMYSFARWKKFREQARSTNTQKRLRVKRSKEKTSTQGKRRLQSYCEGNCQGEAGFTRGG